MQAQRWAKVFDVGDYQVAVYICGGADSDDENADVTLGLMVTTMVGDEMCGESHMYPGVDIDGIRAKLDGFTIEHARAWISSLTN